MGPNGHRVSAVFSVVTANVNGIRAAGRRGGVAWLADCGADVWCLQEVRADDAVLDAELGAADRGDSHVAHTEGAVAGRAGVAIVSRYPLRDVRIGPGPAEFVADGRWVEATVELPAGPVRIASAYAHTGEAGTGRQAQKMRFLDAVEARLVDLGAETAAGGGPALVCGDLNVAHREVDIKNWRPNRTRAGFLPVERAYLDRWFDEHGWVDLGRRLGGDGPGPYTWWSWRGRGFDTDGGWRIDYQLATPDLAERARSAVVGKAATYAQRWSDHAPLTVTFD